MSSLGQDLRYAVRSLLRRPGFALVATLTLALGIGATTAIFSVVNSVLLEPLPFANSERIVTLWQRNKDEPRVAQLGMVPTLDFADWRVGSSSFEAMAQYRSSNFTLFGEDGAELVPGGQVTPEFFRVFGNEPVLGRTFTEDEARYQGPRVAIISHGFWQERLGGVPDVLGSTLQLQGTTYQIVGVAPERFEFPSGARIWLPVQSNPESCGRGCVQYSAVALLHARVPVERARAEIVGIAERLERDYPNANAGVTGDVATLHEVMIGDVRQALFVVFGAVFMVLLIACANVANLMLVRGTARSTELAVRAVLGAGRGRLLSQLVTESAVIAVIGTVVGVVLASWGVDVLRDIAPASFPRTAEMGLDARALLFAALIAGITIALFGLAPALQMSRAPFAQTLREGGRGATGGRHRTRALILGVEVALSVMLLLGAGLMLRSLARMRSVDPGFSSAGVTHFRFSLPSARYPDPAQSVRFVESMQERLAAVPGVENAGFIMGLPMSRLNVFGGFTRTDQPPPGTGLGPTASYRSIDPNYIAALRVPLVSGRNFLSSDRVGTQPVVIIDEALARRYFRGEDPVGKQIDVQVSTGYPDTLPRTIVGVIGSVHARSLTEEPEPALYVPDTQAGAGFGHFVIRSTRGTAEVLRAAREALGAVDAQVPMIRPGSMDELLADDRSRHTFYLLLLGMFALLAVTLAAVGMYGVVAFAVAQRTREIGVRMALGARAREVISLVVWQGLHPALVGAAIGLAGALAAGRILSGLLFQVAPRDPLTLLGVTVVLLGVVALACSIPARRATRIPPAIALRSE